MKIYTTAILLLTSTIANATYNPKMRNNFGANHAILRLNAGYFGTIYQVSKPTQSELSPASQAPSMLSSMRLGLEAMIMVNNRGRFSESVMKSRPVFMFAKVMYDGFEANTIMTAGYAHGLKCMASFPLMGQVKGYFSIGAAALVPDKAVLPGVTPPAEYGARVGYNVYNRSSAMQFDTYIFENQVLVSAVAHKKLGENVLLDAGISRNQPTVGFSAMIGSCRLSASTQYSKNNFQSGVNLTANF
ncbi:MAG: hypothetical protein JNM67_08850 [Bacteroidetes bacterium]|nr:hypothetical protein [Bacteroidota bacterium]